MIRYQRFCDQCDRHIADSHADVTLRDNSINIERLFCDMACLRKWVMRDGVIPSRVEFFDKPATVSYPSPDDLP